MASSLRTLSISPRMTSNLAGNDDDKGLAGNDDDSDSHAGISAVVETAGLESRCRRRR